MNIAIDKIVAKAKNDLRNAGVTGNTTEMGLISRQEIEQSNSFEGISTYDVILSQLNKLSKIPESLSDIQVPKFEFDTSFFNDIITSLITIYPKSEWDEEFVKFYKDKRNCLQILYNSFRQAFWAVVLLYYRSVQTRR